MHLLLISLYFFAITALASLQDLAYCDPLAKDETCPPDPAFINKTSFDFNLAGWNSDLTDFWSFDTKTASDHSDLNFVRNNNGVAVTMNKNHPSPTFTSHKYLLFGRVTVQVKAAKGPGVITAIVLKSDSGDEIDWEMLGAYDTQAQSNYYYDGQALFNTFNTTYKLSSSSFDAFHLYTVEWTDKFLKFSIDNVLLKTWHIGDSTGPDTIPAHKWPQTPMQLKLGIWAVNASTADAGEIVWAGGVPTWDKHHPYTAYFNNIEIEDYKGWCEDVNPGDVEYQYDERTKGWQDVKVLGCKKRRAPGVISPENPKPHSSGGDQAGQTASQTGHDAPKHTDDKNGAVSNGTPVLLLAALVAVSCISLL